MASTLCAIWLLGCEAEPNLGLPHPTMSDVEQSLTLHDTATLWDTQGLTIQACWVASPASTDAGRQAAMEVIADTWARHSDIAVNFSPCLQSTQEGTMQQVRVQPRSCAGGGQSRSWGTSTLSSPTPDATVMSQTSFPGVDICFNDPSTIPEVAVHEFGHVLGFVHEHLREEDWNAELCADGGFLASRPNTPFGPYDARSVMNYCAPRNSALTRRDIDGVRQLYAYPGAALDVALGSDVDLAYVVGTSGNLFAWDGNQWVMYRSGAHVAVDVDPENHPWVVTSDGQVFERDGGWQARGCCGHDIGIGADGSVWLIGRSSRDLFRWTGSSWAFQVAGTFDRIDGAPNGDVVAIDTSGNAFQYDGATLAPVQGGVFRDVAIDRDGTMFFVSSGGAVLRKDGTNWVSVDVSGGPHQRIGAGIDGEIIVRGEDYRIRTLPSYVAPGKAQDISIGESVAHDMWAVTAGGDIARYSEDGAGGGEWTVEISGAFKALDVAPSGDVWMVHIYGNLYRYANGNLTSQPGSNVQDVGVGPGGEVYLIIGNDLYRRLSSTQLQLVNGGMSDLTAVAVDADGNAWVSRGSVSKTVHIDASGSVIEELNLRSQDVSVGIDGTLWVVDEDGYVRYRDSTGALRKASSVSESAQVRVAGGPFGEVAAVDEDGQIRVRGFDYRNSADETDGVQDIGLSPDPDGTLWVIGVSGGLLEWRDGALFRHLATREFTDVDAGPNGTAAAVESNGGIWYYNGTTWTQRPNAARDVALAPNGDLYIVGQSQRDVHKWDGTGWPTILVGTFETLDAGPGGDVWAVEDDGELWTNESGSFQKVYGKRARDVAISTDGRVFIADDLSAEGWIFERTSSGWRRRSHFNPYVTRLTAGPNGIIGSMTRGTTYQVMTGVTP